MNVPFLIIKINILSVQLYILYHYFCMSFLVQCFNKNCFYGLILVEYEATWNH